MPFPSLRSFVDFLESKNDLVRIKAEVDPVLEITEIATRVVRGGGPALLFENVAGSRFPCLINVLGAERRVRWALGRSAGEAGEELARFADGLMPPSWPKLWSRRKTAYRILQMRPSEMRGAPVLKERIEPANLGLLPIAQSWPDDGGRFITFPLVVTQSPVDGKANMGVYRMHVYGPNQTGMHWQIGKGGGYHYQQAEADHRALPVAVVAGADPILLLCGVLPLPENVSELAFAGFLRGAPTKTVQLANGLRVPAEAEFVLEGSVPPNERRIEGPYGDHFGHYSHAAPFPVFHIDRIWHRPNPIFPIAVVGKPPQEDQVLGDAVQELMLPLLKLIHPEIVDLWAYQEAGFHNLLVAAVRQRFAKEAIKTGLWALGEGQLALSKIVVLVDPDVDARRFPAVLRAIRANFHPKEDFVLLAATSQDTLDFTSFKMNLGSKMILDATSKPGRPPRAPGKPIDPKTVFRLDPRILDVRLVEETLLVVRVARGAPGREILEKMVTLSPLSVELVAAVSEDIPLDDPTLLLWGLFTRFDCARDTFFGEARLERGHPVYGGPLYIDASWKPGYPEPLTMTGDIVRRVDRRWSEYGITGTF